MMLPLMIIISSVIGGFIFALWFIDLRKSHRLILKSSAMVGDQQSAIVQEKRMLEKYDKELKSIVWKSVWWQPKFQCEKPPKAAVQVGDRGKKFAEGWKVSDEQIAWIKEEGLTKDKIGKEVDTQKVFSMTDKQFVINQFIKAEDSNLNRRKMDAQKVVQMVQSGILGLVIIVGLIFGADILNGYKEIQDQQVSMMQMANTCKASIPQTVKPTTPAITTPTEMPPMVTAAKDLIEGK